MIVRVHVPRAQGRDFSDKLIQKPMADKPYAASVDSPEGGRQWMLIGSLTRRGERACVGFLFRCYSDPNIVLTRAKLMPASFFATRLKETSNTCRDVCMREIVAFE
jgi:hypothetical protein